MHEVLVLQHIGCEGPARIAENLRAEGIRIRVVRTDVGESVPHGLGGASGLVIMGGPMAVYERTEHPYLDDELRLVEHAVRANVPVLGVCLGSQILAAALGARVYPGAQKEIGWFDVTLREAAETDLLFSNVPERFEALHWHGDVFDLPEGATSLASSEKTEHQAFRYGKSAYGLLFHLEADVPHVRAMADAFQDELTQSSVDVDTLLSHAPDAVHALAPIAAHVLHKWATLLQ